MSYLYLSEIAAGYNHSGSLANITSIKPTGDNRYFVYPQMYGHFNKGVRASRLNSRLFFRGWPDQSWLFSILTRYQYDYLRDTYCGGGYDGEITFKTRTDRWASYTIWNGILVVPELTTVQLHNKLFEDFPIKMIRMQFLS